jgi:cytochrome c oxidase subunit II
VNKFWSILFGIVMGACGLSFIIAPAMGWGLPEGVSSHAGSVDNLYYLILYITGFFFFLTEAILVVFMFSYTGEGSSKPARPTGFPGLLKPFEGVLHDSHRIEMAWTLIPAIILLFIAFVQIGAWEEVKYQKLMPEFGKEYKDTKAMVPHAVDVSARQFEWRIRYPHPERIKRWREGARTGSVVERKDFESFARTRQADDVDDVNELHAWKGHPTVVYLSTRDVIHSFNIPMMRVKQDALPGKVIPVWFVPTKANTAWDEKAGEYVDRVKYDGDKMEHGDKAARWDIPCAELCGWGHYRMIGRVYVHNTEAEFMDWLEKHEKRAHAVTGSR